MADYASEQTCSTSGGHCSSGASSPSRLYQATVEDDPESCIEGGSCYKNAPSLFGDDDEASGPAQSQSGSPHRPSVLRSARPHASQPTKDKEDQAPRPSRIRHENLHVHFSDRQPPQTYSVKAPPPEDTRPRQNSSRPRVSSNGHHGRFKSAVDTRWGLLFSENGLPTERLTQLLAGIAEHLISEQDPRNSLVISPKKLQSFYTVYASKDELISFPALFRCTSSKDYKALGSIYRDMQCQYHLVPEGKDDAPNMPALTADGFVRWMICCILADPDQEAHRLNKIVQALPIESRKLVEGGGGSLPERVPKHFSRYLLPAKPHETIRTELLQACEAKTTPSPRSSAAEKKSPTTSPRRSSSKRGQDEHRDDISRRYMPQSRADDVGKECSRSRSTYRHSTRQVPEKSHHHSGRDRHSPDRSSRHYRDASPRSSRRSVVYETSSSSYDDDGYYRDRGHGDRFLKRASSTRSSRRLPSPSRGSRHARDPSPDHYHRHGRGSHYSSSGDSSPRDSFEGDFRSRYDRQGHRVYDNWGDSQRREHRR